MVYLGLSILLLCADFTFSEFCVSENPCRCVLPDHGVIDLSSVGSPKFPRFYEVLFEYNCSKNLFYSYNPCFAFDSPDKHTVAGSGHTPCVEASACTKGTGGTDGEPPEEHAIGLQNTAVFGNNSTYTYINYTAPGSDKTLMVLLQCNNSADTHVLSMVEPECPENNQITLMLTSKCACSNGCKSVLPTPESPGLSTGSKILIAFFTILLAYLIIGIVWNYCNGAKGTELIPNLEFWNELPTLIMEGVAFTCSCCGRQSSYGAV